MQLLEEPDKVKSKRKEEKSLAPDRSKPEISGSGTVAIDLV